MSIERMEKVLLCVPARFRLVFIDWLYREREIHIEEFSDIPDGWSERFHSIHDDPLYQENQQSKLQNINEFFSDITPSKTDFLESLFPVKILSTKEEIEKAIQTVDAEVLSTTCHHLKSDIQILNEKKTQYQAERDYLSTLDFITGDLGTFSSLKHIAFHFVSVSQSQLAFEKDSRFSEGIFYEQVMEKDNVVISIIAAPLSKDNLVQEIIHDYHLHEIEIPKIEGTIADRLSVLDSSLREIASHEKQLTVEAKELAHQWKHKITLACAYWESEKERIIQQERMAVSERIFVVKGFIRGKNVETFRARLEEKIPGAGMIELPITKSDEPPVSLSWNKWLRPAGLLVKMFGAPVYRSIDPTAFLTVTFLMFFGICFGDVLYGSMLVAVAEYLKRRFRDQRGLVEFFRLFSYGGVSTIIFGIVTGSWGADLPVYFGEGNVVNSLRMKLTLLDPLVKPLIALIIAVGIGITNQLYGIFMRFLRDVRKGDVEGSLYDGVLWLVYLISLLVCFISFIAKTSRVVTLIALGFFVVSAIGLVLTQGRAEKGWLPRLITGVISLYGIVGSYGTTAFVGDVISYSRLMALGMTTYVVGMSFNIIANMLREIPYIGIVLFILMVVFGHVFNFVMSILSAFVHSARLILLEWFGRFYEGGGVPFRPFGFTSNRLELVESL